jgi:hypothetical protein
VNAGEATFSLRNCSEDAYATLAVPECFVPPDEDGLELPQAAAASPTQVIMINPPKRADLLNLGIATIF